MKCLVWDLDQTLWRGILLEDGEPELSDAIRDVIIGLDARGILQSVASRNDHDQTWEWLEKLGVDEYFVLPQIGWGRKSDSVREIAEGGAHLDDAILGEMTGVLKALASIIDEGVRAGAFRPINPFLVHAGIVGPVLLFFASEGIRRRVERSGVRGAGTLARD